MKLYRTSILTQRFDYDKLSDVLIYKVCSVIRRHKRDHMNKKIITILLACTMLAFTGCSVNVVINGNGNTAEVSDRIEYSFATKDEGIELLISNKEYYDGFTQNDLDFRMQKKDAVMDEYLDFAKDQVLDFTEEEKSAIDRIMSEIEDA